MQGGRGNVSQLTMRSKNPKKPREFPGHYSHKTHQKNIYFIPGDSTTNEAHTTENLIFRLKISLKTLIILR